MPSRIINPRPLPPFQGAWVRCMPDFRQALLATNSPLKARKKQHLLILASPVLEQLLSHQQTSARHDNPGTCYAGDPTAIHVQSAEGDAMSVIDTPTALDAALATCNRKGNREKALMNALKRDHSSVRDQLRGNMPRGVTSSRPPLEEEQNGGLEVGKTDRITIQV